MPRTSYRVLVAVTLLGACAHAPSPVRPATPAAPASRTTEGDRTAAPPGGPTTGATPAGGVSASDAGGPTAGAGGPAEPTPRPYDRVVTKAAKSRDGLFKTHRIGSRLLFEIPSALLRKDLLVVPRAAKAPAGGPYGGQLLARELVVRWERRDNRMLLRQVKFDIVADPATEISRAVENSTFSTVLAAFPVDAYGPDSAAVIDVTRLFTSPPAEIGPGATLRGALDASRSFIDRVAGYPTNVEVEALLTASLPPTPSPRAPSPFFAVGGQYPGSSSLLMHWSIVRLPEQPMMPRLADSRVGYYTNAQVDYGRDEQRATTRTYIRRYRLEKRDPNAALSDPVKPITYYVDPATPKWLVPWVKKGIEDWKPAFEAAGFRDGIVAKEAPTATEDPDWSPEDARYSVIRWLPSNIPNAQGPNVMDPRSGEIIEADIYMYHDILSLQRQWYFAQVGHLDPRARTGRLPDSLMGRLIEYVVAHEVGHTLGFQHNHKASATYPVDSLRSPTWLARMGHTPSIMDYSRMNYLVQPQDSVPVSLLIPDVGVYDKWATRWGYAPIPGARTADDERPTLDRWSREQDATPWYRFGPDDSRGADPTDHTEAVGDGDPVKATSWGLQSLKQVLPLTLGAATTVPGDDFTELRELYGTVVSQWATELSHVTTDVGGAAAQEKHVGQDGPRYLPLPRARQAQAVRFLNEHAFATPTWLLRPEILPRLEVEGALRRIGRAQSSVLAQLLDDRRLERLVEFQALAASPSQIYSANELLTDLRRGLFVELDRAQVRIDPFRRELQRAFLSQAESKLNPPAPPSGMPPEVLALIAPARSTSDVRSLFRATLGAIDASANRALGSAADAETRAHLTDVRATIDRILHPNR